MEAVEMTREASHVPVDHSMANAARSKDGADLLRIIVTLGGMLDSEFGLILLTVSQSKGLREVQLIIPFRPF
jgi:hypothetical protein